MFPVFGELEAGGVRGRCGGSGLLKVVGGSLKMDGGVEEPVRGRRTTMGQRGREGVFRGGGGVICTVSLSERQFATVCLFHEPMAGGVNISLGVNISFGGRSVRQEI